MCIWRSAPIVRRSSSGTPRSPKRSPSTWRPPRPTSFELESKGLSGLEAYNLYGAYALRHVTQRGGKLVLFNGVVQQLIGAEGGWHQIASMQYNNVDAFIDMVQDPDYREGLVHRDAGLARTEIIVSRSLFPGSA